jgi:hypothetical protein
MYRLAKSLDPTRLVEDNSACNYDHTETDLNTWHAYLPGYAWAEFMENASRNTYPGSQWNFAPGYRQGRQPMLNSECGNVWGYEGSTGDVDWTWDYHIMMNEFQKHPKMAGWLYTEHHDVINEWNGYYRYDRSEKQTGLEEILPGMSLRDLHSDFTCCPTCPCAATGKRANGCRCRSGCRYSPPGCRPARRCWSTGCAVPTSPGRNTGAGRHTVP